MEKNSPMWRDIRFSDTIVDCLFAGFAAGIGMAAVLIISGILFGSSIAVTLARFSPKADNSAVTGILAHLAVSGIYGIIFGIGWGAIIR